MNVAGCPQRTAGWCEGTLPEAQHLFLCFVGALSTSRSSFEPQRRAWLRNRKHWEEETSLRNHGSRGEPPVRTAVPGSTVCSGEGARKPPRFCLGCNSMWVHNVVFGEKTDITLRCLCVIRPRAVLAPRSSAEVRSRLDTVFGS